MIPGLVTKCPRCFSIIDDNAYLWTVSPNVPGQRRYADRVGSAYHGAPVDIGAMHEVRRPPGYHGPLPSSAMEASQALGGPAIEICPVCHFVLPTGWRSGQAICIAMAGARATGKSLYVAVLIKQLEQLCERLGVSIGDPVLMHPGVYVIHGQIVLDGIVEVGTGAVIGPWVTIGLRAGNVQGAVIDRDVSIGTGAKVIGPVTIGARAQIGANAVVVDDVEADATVVGVPARPAA